MNKVEHFIARIAKEYGYKPLNKVKSEKARAFYRTYLNGFEELGSEDLVFLPDGSPFSKGYNRVVVGDYGAFIEFDEKRLIAELEVQKGQEFRQLPKYKTCKYNWLAPVGWQDKVKVYEQRAGVAYADYKANCYYVSVFELKSSY